MASTEGAVDNHWTPGRFGVEGDAPGVTLERLRPSAIVEVIARRGTAGAALADLQPPVGTVVHKKNSTLLWTAPRRFWAISPGEAPAKWVARWEKKCAGAGYVTDLSQARFGLRIAGPAARDLLAKGCPVDVDTFAGNQCAGTVCEGMPVVLHGRGDEPGFDLWIMRSYARSLTEWMTHSAAEFGYTLV